MVEPRDGGGMQHCGCQIGRPCTCGMRMKRVMERIEHADDAFEDFELAPGVVMRLKKEYENVPGTRLYRLMRLYRLSLLDAIQEMAATIELAVAHKRCITTDLAELTRRKELLASLSASDTLGIKQKRDAMHSTQHMISRYADLNVTSLQVPPGEPGPTPVALQALEPHLARLLELVLAAITKTRFNLSTCKTFVQMYAMTRIQCIVRGRLERVRLTHDLVTFWCCAEMGAAVRLQSLFRRLRAAAKVEAMRSEWWATHRGQAAVHLQRLARGFVARQSTHRLVVSRKAGRRSAALVVLQCWWRVIQAQTAVATRRQAHRAAMDVRLRHKSATNIQRVYRGLEGRRALRRLRIEASLSEPVRALAAQYIASGDLWAFLRAVDNDYRRFLHERRDEEENATTFVKTFVTEKRALEERAIQAWHVSRAMESPVLQRQERTASAYASSSSPTRRTHSPERPHHPLSPLRTSCQALGTSSTLGSSSTHGSYSAHGSPPTEDSPSPLDSLSPGSPGRQPSPPKPVAPTSIFSPEASPEEIQLGRLAPESIDLPDKYSAKLIRAAMAEGYSLPEVIAGLRGLEAQGKSIGSFKLLLRELRGRAPLMLNPFRSERAVRAAEPPKRRPIHTLWSKKPIAAAPAREATNDRGVSVETEAQQYVLASLPAKAKEPIAKFLFVAGVRSFVPPMIDGGDTLPPVDPWWTGDRLNPAFVAYLQMPSGLLKVRREQLVTQALETTFKTLKARGIVHAQDLVPLNVDHVIAWSVPEGLARSMFDLLQTLLGMTHNGRPATVLRQLQATARPSTQDTVAYDAVFSPRTETPVVLAKAYLDKELHLFLDMKARIQEQVLAPVAMTSSIYELLFQATFTTIPLHAEDLVSYSSAHLDAFVHQLVAPTLDVNGTQRLLKKRSQRAAAIARDFSNVFRAAGCHVVRDIVHRQLHVFQLPPGLDEQVRTLVGRLVFASPTPHRRGSPAHNLAPLARPTSSSSTRSNSPATPTRHTLEPLASPLISRGKRMLESMDESDIDDIVNVLDDDALWGQDLTVG
ncbi:hypothetical protein ACHHYP_00481 [Achlya hypogyna]|uniref:Uncharacterized protein n=1 Tax=Achlya hypogyna TaxID=1202772 RepID=A0A1V9ZAV2_ACHHY|nr:hypothetical protein ACHHYP_00481 [Achlya hypogyna]